MSVSLSSSLPLASSGAEPRSRPRNPAGSLDRAHLLDRLDRLRAILPAFAEELASSRRQTAALRVENRGLLAEVRRLQRETAIGDSSCTLASNGGRSIRGGWS